MVVLDIKLDNLYSFKNFHINFTYPKKIVNSYISGEHLPNRPNFRYKKVNVLLGANASGKTSLGRVMMLIFNFIKGKNYEFLSEMISDKTKEASFSLDLASANGVFYRIVCVINPHCDGEFTSDNILLSVVSEKIRTRDSYESCVKRIKDVSFDTAQNYVSELEKIGNLAWLFEYPKDNKRVLHLPNRDEKFRFVLENILKTLDTSIKEVKISQDVDNAYVIVFSNKSVIIQNEQILDTNFLSSGTKSGIEIANVVSSLMSGHNGFYYCDEKFSYIHTDVEKALLSLMIEFVDSGEQLFFTTHNTDILDMNLPKHSFYFMRKDVNNPEQPITCVEASSLLKRNTDSLRCAVENDLFLTAPDVELIFNIAED